MKIRPKELPRQLEKVFVVLALMLFTGAFLTVFSRNAETVDSNLLAQASYVGIYGIAFLLVATQLQRFIYLSSREPLLLLLVGFALISVLWSAAPDVTLRRSIALMGTTLFGAYFALRFSLREQLQLLAWALGLAALFSLVFALALPGYGTMSDSRGDALQGIYHQKNVLGRNMALGAVVFALLALGSREYRWFKWGLFALSFVLLLLSGAKTALVIMLTIAILLPFYRALREAYTITVPILVGGVLAGSGVLVWFLDNLDNTFAVLGRDTSLTGRTDLWPAVIDMIAERPWLGYGYNAFWLGWEGKSAQVWLTLAPSSTSSDYTPTHAHNGILDLWLDLGFLGVFLFVVVFVLTLGRAVRLIRSTRTIEGAWPLAYLTFMLLSSITYPIGLERNSIWWVLYVAIVVNLAAQPGLIRDKKERELDYVPQEKHWSRVG